MWTTHRPAHIDHICPRAIERAALVLQDEQPFPLKRPTELHRKCYTGSDPISEAVARPGVISRLAGRASLERETKMQK